MRGRIGWTLAATVCVAVLAAGCSSDDGGSDDAASDTTEAAAETTTTTAPAETLDILVSNDDGFDAEGIDAVVEALIALPDTNVTVVAPAENQSGSGGNTTPGELTATEEETLSGYPVTAVQGFPADAVNYGLENVVEDCLLYTSCGRGPGRTDRPGCVDDRAHVLTLVQPGDDQVRRCV